MINNINKIRDILITGFSSDECNVSDDEIKHVLEIYKDDKALDYEKVKYELYRRDLAMLYISLTAGSVASEINSDLQIEIFEEVSAYRATKLGIDIRQGMLLLISDYIKAVKDTDFQSKKMDKNPFIQMAYVFVESLGLKKQDYRSVISANAIGALTINTVELINKIIKAEKTG